MTQLTRIPRSSSSVFSRLFGSEKPVNVPHESPLPNGPTTSLTTSNAAPRSPCSSRSQTSLSPLPSLPHDSPLHSLRPGIGQPPVFRRPAPTLGTAASGIILPRRKDGRDLWAAEDNVLDEEPDAQERLKSQILVTTWFDAGADAQEASGKSEEEEQGQAQEVGATPAPSPPSKLVLRIDTGAHKSPPTPSLVVNLVDSDDDDREDRVPELDPSASSTAGSPSTMTHYTGESVWSPVIRSPSERDTSSGMLLPTIAEPDAITAENRDQFSGDPLLLGLNPPLGKNQRHRSVLGIASFGSRRFPVKSPARANTAPAPNGPAPPTTSTKAGRRRSTLSSLVRRQNVLPPPSEAELARAEEKMVQPTIHTMGTLTTHIMDLEDEEERRLAELAYFG